MRQPNNHRAKWVQTEAAKHTTPDIIRRRIAHEQKQISTLRGLGLSSPTAQQALEMREELVRVLTKRLAQFKNAERELGS